MNKKKILLALCCILCFCGCNNIKFKSEKKSFDVEKLKNIETTISNDYKYFNISVENFYNKISYELSNNNIGTKELRYINYDDEYDLYYMSYCEWNYAIDLNNSDRILLCSSDNGKTISSIGYDFTKNISSKDVEIFIGVISKLFISNFNNNDFIKKVGNEFLQKNETYDFSTANARYVYNHILYGVDKNINKNNNSKYIFAILAPNKATTYAEWKENLLNELKSQDVNEKENNNIKNDNISNNSSKNENIINNSNNDTNNIPSNKIDDNQKEMVMATCQIALKEYTENDFTSFKINDWNVNNQIYNSIKRWTTTTYDSKNNRVKCIFEWSGNDNDDLILKYLLYEGKEYVNDLKK